jgi:hypothetical protein
LLLETMMALALWREPATDARHETLEARGFESFVQAVQHHRADLAVKVRKAKPARLLELENDFRAQLSGPARGMIDARLGRGADGAIAGCEGREEAACAVEAYLSALRETKLTDAFVLYLAGHAGRLR